MGGTNPAWENRIDWAQAKFRDEQIKAKRADLIAEIEECAVDLHDAYFGNEFSRESLLKSEEFLMMYAGFLRGLN